MKVSFKRLFKIFFGFILLVWLFWSATFFLLKNEPYPAKHFFLDKKVAVNAYFDAMRLLFTTITKTPPLLYTELGIYGEKKDIEYLIYSLKGYSDKTGKYVKIRNTFKGSITSSLEKITGQVAGEEYADWLEWFYKNKDKSQQQWVSEQMKKDGVLNDDMSDKEVINSVAESFEKYFKDRFDYLTIYKIQEEARLWYLKSRFDKQFVIDTMKEYKSDTFKDKEQFERYKNQLILEFKREYDPWIKAVEQTSKEDS